MSNFSREIYGCPIFSWVSNFSSNFFSNFSMGVQFFSNFSMGVQIFLPNFPLSPIFLWVSKFSSNFYPSNFSCSPGIRHHLENRSLTLGKKKTCMCNGGMLVVLVFRSGCAESNIPEPKGCVSIKTLVFSL